MARIEWVKLRLNNWALWKARQQGGGLGFKSSSVFMQESTSGMREAVIPVDEVDASITDDGVKAMQFSKPQLHRTLVLIYLEDAGIRGAARKECCGESTIKARLDQADHALSKWFGERAERQRAALAARATGHPTFTP